MEKINKIRKGNFLYIGSFFCMVLFSNNIFATAYTWSTTATSTNWATAGNWTPNGVPTTGDDVTIINRAAFQPTLDQSRDIAAFTIISGTLSLGGFTLTAAGATSCVGGAVNNGTIRFNGSNTTFSATPTFGAVVNINAAGTVNFFGGIFNNSVIVTGSILYFGSAGGVTFNGPLVANQTGAGFPVSYGNCTFSTATFINSGTGAGCGWGLGGTDNDIYNGPVTFTTLNDGDIYPALSTSAQVTTFADNITVNSLTAGGLVSFSANSSTGTVVLNPGKTIMTGTFSAGELKIRKFTATADVNLTLTGTALLTLSGAAFGNVNFTAPEISVTNTIMTGNCTAIAQSLSELKTSTFSGTTYLEKTGASANQCFGSNIFNGITTIVNSSNTDILQLGVGGSDAFNNNVTFKQLGTGALQPAYGNFVNTFSCSISTVGSNAAIVFGAGAGASTSVNMTCGSGTKYINGDAAFPPVFYRLKIITTGGAMVSLGVPVTINKLLTMTTGKLILDVNNLTIASAASISGGTSTNYIVTNSTGKLIQNNIGTGGRTGVISFPVGYSTTAYTPVTINNAGTADAFNVVACQYQHTDGTCAGVAENIADVVRVTWQVTEAVAGSSNATITVAWNAADEGPNFNNTNCGVTTYTGAGWTVPSSYSNASATRTLSKTLTTLYPLSVRDNSTSNMTYVSSTVLQNNTDTVLQYATRKEIICIRIYVEGSASPLDMDRFDLNTNGGNGTGSEDPANDLTKAEIFYTGASSTFATTTLYNKKNNPNGAFNIVKAGAFRIVEGYNYFWLTYNIDGAANTLHNVDAQLVSFKLNGVTYTDMAVSAPVGKRSIRGGDIYYAIGSGNINDATIWSWNLSGGGDNGPTCNCAPNGTGVIIIDTNRTITINSSRLFDGMIIQQGGLVNYSGSNRNLRLNDFFSTTGTGRFQLDSVNVMGDLILAGSGASTTNSFINVAGDMIVGSGTSLSPGNNLTVGGNLTVNGTISLGAKTLTMAGINNFEIDGQGSVTGSNKFIVNAGDKTFINNVTIQQGVDIQGDYTVTNKDSVIIQGSLTGTSALSTWVNDTNAVLVVSGSMLPTGQLTAVSPNNKIYYNGATQTVKATIYNDIKLLGSGTKTLAGDITVNGNLTITSVTLDASSGLNYGITLGGNWSNAGTFFARNGVVTVNGTGAQSISKASGETFYDLILNKSSNDLTLSNSATVNHLLTLSGGKIILGSSNLTMGNSASIATPSSTKYIVTNSTGKLVQNNIGSGGRTGGILFPVGSGTSSYTPITVDNTAGTADAFDVRVFDEVYDGGTTGTAVTTRLVRKTWMVAEAVAGSANVTLTAQWNAADEGASFDRTSCGISHYMSSAWDIPTYASASGSNPYTISRSGITSFSPFAVESSTHPLPISLLSFDAKLENTKVTLAWVTASEINNDYFTVERSSDGINFESVIQIQGAGNSTSVNRYNTRDESPLNGVSYYRLKQTDFDGNYTYSNIVSINMKTEEAIQFSVYPNPSDGKEINIRITSGSFKEVLVVVYDAQGEEKFSKILVFENTNNQVIAIDPSEKLSQGIYLIEATSNNKMYRNKLIIR